MYVLASETSTTSNTCQELKSCLYASLSSTGVTLASPYNGLSQSLQFILKYMHAHMHTYAYPHTNGYKEP